MTAKFLQIIAQLKTLAPLDADSAIPDDDFIAGIDAICLLCSICDDLDIDSSDIRSQFDALFSESTRRIYAKPYIRQAIPLIQALKDLISISPCGQTPAKWQDTYTTVCENLVDSYRDEPPTDTALYLFALARVCRHDSSRLPQYQAAVDSLLCGIDEVDVAEKVLRVKAYDHSRSMIAPERPEAWAQLRRELKYEDVGKMSDSTFLDWCLITDLYPVDEFSRRASSSTLMRVEYLRALTIAEFEEQSRLQSQRKIDDDDIIGDIIAIDIDTHLSASTLRALATIFDLRLSLAQISGDERLAAYDWLWRDRFARIAEVHKKKYTEATCLDEKIEALERIADLSCSLHHSNLDFTLKEAAHLAAAPSLTDVQRLRLDLMLPEGVEPGAETIATLLHHAQSASDIATLALLFDDVDDTTRQAIADRYSTLLDAAISGGNTAEAAHLLAIAAPWNSYPSLRPLLATLADKAQALPGISLPEKRINAIAAEIYTRIDSLI